MYKCQHFKIQELVTPQMYSTWGVRCWSLFDDRLLRTLDALRKLASAFAKLANNQ
ncbi:TPA: hypothetical protein NJ423_003404 [Vibrio parahaemolyticus]|uniref:hypothetical protein n=1 Tax=Vibrio parahaemolyticus TaxID=670 RepID=UPI0015DDE5A7|nr:hypothetical protein [Vibrio parahaemolyticus]MCG6509828.1 hypothetical protein [Vibrio parahaemolyticus]HBC3824791.1 hypothetical protein [Vibrio parahaemolyticus]HBC3891590.1 hypothetical protein [Vibrio parahaemolyticus]HCG5284602.1 hypothetical protein [Vibrio parahaemolyticus]HCG5511297.1 hypothetical protein [Vibrio parahaemolyticus]